MKKNNQPLKMLIAKNGFFGKVRVNFFKKLQGYKYLPSYKSLFKCTVAQENILC